jgi:phosphoglycolate phosphatase
MKQTVHVLSQRGFQLAVLTNKNQAPAEVISQHYFGHNTFDPIIGAAEGRTPKPDPTTTLEILQQWNLSPDEVLFVGDSETDVQTSINAGVCPVGCLWGFRSRDQLIEAGATILIHHPRELLNCIG